MNPLARCNREKLGKKDVPIVGEVKNMADYDVLYVGFPIWYGSAPNIINTFLKAYDLDGKKIWLFATSIRSGIGKTAERLKPFAPGAEFVSAMRFGAGESKDVLRTWAETGAVDTD